MENKRDKINLRSTQSSFRDEIRLSGVRHGKDFIRRVVMVKTFFLKGFAAFFAVLLFSVSLFSATLKVKVNSPTAALPDAVVLAVGFIEGSGEPSDYLYVAKTSTGGTGQLPIGEAEFINISSTDAVSGKKITYKIGFVKQKYLPTIKEQINNPNIPRVSFSPDTVYPTPPLSDSAAANGNIDLSRTPFIMNPTPSDFKAGVLNIKISTAGITDGTLFLLDLRHHLTDESVSVALQPKIGQDLEGKFGLQIYNVPPAPANTYRLFVMRAGTLEGAEVIVSTAIYNDQDTFQDVRLGFISGTRSDVTTTVDVSKIAFEGIVVNKSSQPIANCSVEIRDMDPTYGRQNFFRTLTDVSGKFVVHSPVSISSYSVQISKLGYKSKFDNPDGKGYYYAGNRVLLPKYFLDEATGTIKGRITLNNKGLPDAWVHLKTEWDWFVGPYPKQPDQGGWFNTTTKGDGSYELKGLAPGQYNLEINHNTLSKGSTIYWKGGGAPNPAQPWNWRYVYNYGGDHVSSKSATAFDPDGPGSLPSEYYRLTDDRRIVITSDTIKSIVYSTAGVVLVGENADINIDFNVPLSTNAGISGMIYFSLDAPTIDVSKFKIIARPMDPDTREWIEHKGQGTVFYADSAHLVASYTKSATRHDMNFRINVSTGAYFVEIKSDKWILARWYNTEARLNAPGDIFQLPDIKMVKAGRLEGKIKLPDGSYFQARSVATGLWRTKAEVRVRGIDVEFGREERLETWSQDPTKFIFESLPPGKYNLWIHIREESSGGGVTELYPTTVISNVRISADQVTFVEATVKDGIMCEPLAPIPPDKPEVDYTSRSTQGAGVYGIIVIPSALSLNGSMLQLLINNEGMLEDIRVPSLSFDPVRRQWQTEKLLPGKYNFYMVFLRRFGVEPYDPQLGGLPRNNPDEYLTVVSRAENVNVKPDDLAPGATFQIKMGAGVMGSGIITGRVKGKNILRPADGEKIKGNFNEFLNYVPTVMLYDMEGNWRGYSGVRPPLEHMLRWFFAIMAGNVDAINNMINSDDTAARSHVHYYIDNLPAGKYVLVCETENYPPATKIITISTGTTTLNIDFDKDAMMGAKISGLITDENNNPLSEANIILTHRLITDKVLSGSDGKFEVPGLPAGAYKIDVTKVGYATGGDKISLGKEDRTITIKLKTASAKISGKIYVRESDWSKKNVYSGAKVVAYNETENVINPAKYLPATTLKTENDGSYLIPDIILNNTYYVYAFVPERPVYYKRVYVSTNTMADIDFDIKPSTPTLKISMKRTENPYIFRFIIESPRPLVTTPECYYSPGATYDETKKVRALPTKGVKNSYALDVETPRDSNEENYTLRVKGQYGMNEYMTETLTFSQKSLMKAKKEVADELAEGGAILIDDERDDNTELKLTPGTLTSEEMAAMPLGGFLSALPNIKITKTSREISRLVETAMSDIVASDVYDISLDRAQVNKSFDVALKFDRAKVGDKELKDLKIYRYNEAGDKWVALEGVVTVDPLAGIISLETDSLATATQSKPAPKSAVKNGVFAINRAAPTSQKGVFVVFTQDPATAAAYAGKEFVIYNFPNPFDLKTKSVVLQDVTSNSNQAVKGTVIKYALPANKGGKIKLYIYNLAGELVRTIDEGDKIGGRYWYIEWDGKNDRGNDCASGVYFLIAEKDGEKLNSKPHKMAIIK